MNHSPEAHRKPAAAVSGREAALLCVLKFGSSVLKHEPDYAKVALEIYRHVRNSEKVVAVVSAIAGETDALFEQAKRVGGGAVPDTLIARLVRIGELHSAALLALALSKIGIRALTLDPHEMELVAVGDPLDSNLVGLSAERVLAKIGESDVVVLPGFIAEHPAYGIATLGRGGTDLSAIFFAARLGVSCVRFIKDVNGVYVEDPADNPAAERFSQLSYAKAQATSDRLVQTKAIEAAHKEGIMIEIGSLDSIEPTKIAHLPVRKAKASTSERLRVSLLGCGAVGHGVLAHLQSHSGLFEVGPILVRSPEPPRADADFTDNLDDVLVHRPDILIELIGGPDFAAEVMHDALLDGVQVVTANKSAVAKHWDALHACAARSGSELRFSAAVGGGAPIIETLRRLGRSVVAINGVMNGTCNYLLSRLAEGWSFKTALERAQELGFAEADPSADIDGHDTADKLSILIREAFGTALDPAQIAKASLRSLTNDVRLRSVNKIEGLKQLGRCHLLADGSILADVQLVALPKSHPLASVRDEENCFLITDSSGKVHQVSGKGAGRWPTAAAVFADVMDARYALLRRKRQIRGNTEPIARQA